MYGDATKRWLGTVAPRDHAMYMYTVYEGLTIPRNVRYIYPIAGIHETVSY